jgi:hypothetical protein
MYELCVYKNKAMCFIPSSQVPAFICKGRCSNCIRKTILSGERPVPREDPPKIKKFEIRQSNTVSFEQKTENLPAA